ncbi:MAG: protein kinase domain-containing protein [Ardenticatenaceae bacterium]
MDHQAQMLIKARYRLLKLLGEGGVADVWLAHEEPLERLVALKFLRTQYARNEILLERFRREAMLVAKLNSPYIVKVYDVAVDSRHCFIAMEYVDGQDLKTLLRFEAPLSLRRSLKLLRSIAAGVAVAHDAGLIHRDLKPGNILISKQGDVKITDFGIARNIAEAGLTEPDTVWGTSHYLAPEQALGETLSTATDIYSLGVLFFQMLTGMLPYPGDDPVAVALAHIQQPVPALQSVAPSIPTSVAHLIERMMAKNPAYRPQDGTKLVQILNSYIDGSIEPTALRSTSAVKVALPDYRAPSRKRGSRKVKSRSRREDKWTLTPKVSFVGSLVIALVMMCVLIFVVNGLASSPLETLISEMTEEATPPMVITATATLLPTFTPENATPENATPEAETKVESTVVKSTATPKPSDGDGQKVRANNGPDAHALYLTTPPGIILEGNLSEWNTSKPLQLTEPVFGGNRWTGQNDLRGKAYLVWDEEYLYLAVDRIDDAHIQTHEGFDLHRGDSIELWLDVNLNEDFDQVNADQDDFQLVFSPGDFDKLKPEGAVYHPTPRDPRRNYELRVKAEPIVNGYTLEAKIPWSLFKIEPKANMILGYAVVLNDNDPPESPEAQTQVASNKEAPYLKPKTFGNLILNP